MLYFANSSSGIPEAIDNIMSGGLAMGMLFLIGVVTVAAFGLVGFYTDEKRGWSKGWVFLSAATASVLVAALGGWGFKTLAFDSKSAAQEVTQKNVQENFDMQDIDVQNTDNYSEQNKSIVYGSSDGRILEFEVGYSAEHDIMMPIVEPEDLAALPVKEGSTLDSVLDVEEPVEENSETLIEENLAE